MNSSFYNGVSGTKSQQFGIDVWTSNISNINTVGYKNSNPEFSTHFATAMADSYFESTLNDTGNGSQVNATRLDMRQGSFQFTDNVFDLALGDEGWFGVANPNSQILYTRAGEFGKDINGDMVDANGNFLLGTSGNNITPTTLSDKQMQEFGKYYGKDGEELGQANMLEALNDIQLGDVENQTKINLPDILYIPAEATTTISYSANLNPEIILNSTNIDLNDADVVSEPVNIPYQTLSINGTVSNTPALQNPQSDDTVIVTITDGNGKSVETLTQLDSDLNWTIEDEDVSSLDISNPLTTTVKLQTTQEVPNVEHFSSSIFSPQGDKDILDMTFTKRVPQTNEGSVWDGKLEILSFFEDYDSSKTYDPNLYKVDKQQGKVYEIKDKQDGLVEFASSGAILSSNIPTMSNGDQPLSIDIGEPDTFTGFVSSLNSSKVRSESSDGYISGNLKSYGMDINGNVVAEFDNGRTSPVAKVAIYHFQNDQGLNAMGDTSFSYSANSGKPIFYTDDDGKNIQGTKLFSNRLESSNVNFATALTELIIMQKAFSGNAKSITTSDELVQNAINMKK